MKLNHITPSEIETLLADPTSPEEAELEYRDGMLYRIEGLMEELAECSHITHFEKRQRLDAIKAEAEFYGDWYLDQILVIIARASEIAFLGADEVNIRYLALEA